MLVYLDVVFLLNFLVDFFLILGTNRLTGFPPDLKRTALGALLGGLYGSLCLIPSLRFLGSLLWRIVFFSLISLTAFRWNVGALNRGSILFLLSMALGGIAAGTGIRNIGALCLCALLVAMLCEIGFRGNGIGRMYIPVELNWQGRQVKVMALKDTGNVLRDPLTGEQILVCGADVGEELLGVPESLFSNPALLLASCKLSGIRLVPYHAVGQPHGLMVALRLKNVKIGAVQRSPLVAFAPERIGSRGSYRMLTGGMM